ncbi:MAG: undecaprenyldiphospho-muramoylpentapeptide beta-N-acetylglucosaminyltransferase [Patescibacteria group bacterium]
MKILLTGGGTGGHVVPIVVVAQELKHYFHRAARELDLLWVGEKNSQEEKAAKKFYIPYHAIACGKFRRYFSFKNFFDAFKIPLGYLQAKRILKKFKPDAIFSKGGYVSAPVILAARKSATPIFLHESDSIPGQANLYFTKYVKKIFITFPESKDYFSKFKNKAVLTGMPLRSEILHGSKKRGHRIFGLEYGKPVILFCGGSQGAKKINDLVLEILPDLLKKYQVIHLAGARNMKMHISRLRQSFLAFARNITDSSSESRFNRGESRTQLKNYHFFGFLEGTNFADALMCADLIVSRAGANTLFEIAAYAKPVILIPYPYAAADHQTKNAKIFEKMEAAKIIEEKNLSAKRLFSEIEKIIKNEREKEKLSANIFRIYSKLGKNAAEKIVHGILRGDSYRRGQTRPERAFDG